MSNENKTCDLKPVNTNSATDFKICNCKNVSYFNILDALEKHSKVENLLAMERQQETEVTRGRMKGARHDERNKSRTFSR